MIDPTGLAGGVALTGVVIAALAAFWTKIKMLAQRAMSTVFVRVDLENRASQMVMAYLWMNGRRSRYGPWNYNGGSLYLKSAQGIRDVIWEEVNRNPVVFWIGWRPVVATVTDQTSGNEHLGSRTTLVFIRGTFDPDALMVAASSAWRDGLYVGHRSYVRRLYGRSDKSVFSRPDRHSSYSDPDDNPSKGTIASRLSFRPIGVEKEDIGEAVPTDPFVALAFPASVLAVVDEVKQWYSERDWYVTRRIPWRFGALLSGPPGTGKSSIAKAIAHTLDVPIFVIELATVDDGELIKAWTEAASNTPCMILIEDIDTVFEGRKNVLGKKSGLNFGCLLNCVSGVTSTDGVLLVITTNRPETVDPALGVVDTDGRSSRPGRIDRIVEIGPLDEDCRTRIATRVLSDWPDLIVATVAAGAGETGAQFVDRCVGAALMQRRGLPTVNVAVENPDGSNPDDQSCSVRG